MRMLILFLGLSPLHTRKIIVQKYKEAVQTIKIGDERADEMLDVLMYLFGCRFQQQCQLPAMISVFGSI